MSTWMLTFLFFVTSGGDAFLFPDLNPRSRVEESSDKVAALVEEPYLYANGSGYLRDLLEEISRTPLSLRTEYDIPLEIIPVKTWKELISVAESAKHKISFGLQLQESTPVHFKKSIPVVQTSAKLAIKTTAVVALSDVQSTTGNPVIVLRHGPLASLLKETLHYPGNVFQVYTSDQQVELLSWTRPVDSVILGSAEVVDSISSRSDGFLTSLCPSTLVPGTDSMFYGFFGRDVRLVKWLNKALISLTTNGRLQTLNHRYFHQVKHC